MGFSLRGSHARLPRRPSNPTRATRARLARAWFGLAPFRSPLLRRDLTSSGYVRCFSSPAYPHADYVFIGGSQRSTLRGSPIRRPSAPSLRAAPRGISLLRHVLHRHERPRHPPDALRHGPALARGRPRRRTSVSASLLFILHTNALASACSLLLLIFSPQLVMSLRSRPRLLPDFCQAASDNDIEREWWR
jgi:hypothetical protein